MFPTRPLLRHRCFSSVHRAMCSVIDFFFVNNRDAESDGEGSGDEDMPDVFDVEGGESDEASDDEDEDDDGTVI